MDKVNKYMKGLKIGKLAAEPRSEDTNIKEEITKDFRRVRDLAEKMDLYKTDFKFYAMHFLQLVVLEALAVVILNYYGFKSWYAYFAAVALLTIEQVNYN